MGDIGLFLNNKPVELAYSGLDKTDKAIKSVESALKEEGIDTSNLNLTELINGMRSGVGGCESGCPGGAKRFVRGGFPGYDLNYTEGGFIEAYRTENGKVIKIVTFPDTDKMTDW